jgi:flavin reductase (DIM6/NTAB) family NADH-FMN oxidoreductase RutF
VGEEFGPLMEVMERDLPYETSEVEECGLTETPSIKVKPKRIREAFAWLECRVVKHLVLSERNVWVVGEVLNAEVKDECLDGVLNLGEAKPLNHIWGEFFVTEMHTKKFRRAK